MPEDEPDKAEKKPEPRRPGGKTKRGANRWLLRIFRGYDAGGKRIYYSETFHGGSREADDRLVELRNRHKAGLPLKFKAKTFADFFDVWIDQVDDGERREETIRHYRQMATKHLLPAFGKFALTDVTDVAIKRLYKDLRKQEYAPATIGFLHTILTGLFQSAEDADLVLRNPMRKVKAPKLPKPRPVAMNSDQVQAYLDAASCKPEGFMFRLAYFLGARPNEYLGLRWSDFDKKEMRITIQRTLKWRRAGEWYTTPPKTEKGIRAILITPEIARGLEDQRRRQLEARMKAGATWADHGFVFTDEAGEPRNIDHVRHIHKKVLADAGLPATFNLKVSRHSCASALLKADVHPKIVSERLGHAKISTTLDIYSAIEEAQHRDASERLGEMFGIGKK
jgi:integrase